MSNGSDSDNNKCSDLGSNIADSIVTGSMKSIDGVIKNIPGLSAAGISDLESIVSNYACDPKCQNQKIYRRLSQFYNNLTKYNNLYNIKKIKLKRELLCTSNISNDLMYSDFDEYIGYDIKNAYDKIKDEILNHVYDVSNSFNTIIRNYKILDALDTDYTNGANEKIIELNDVKKNIGEYSKLQNIDIRKVYYLTEDYDKYKSIYNYVFILYYSLLVIYLIFGDFVSKKRYSNYVTYIYLIIYILFPFILKYIIHIIYYMYSYIKKSLNLDKPIYSYVDILKASNIKDIYTAPLNTPQEINVVNKNYYDNYLSKFNVTSL